LASEANTLSTELQPQTEVAIVGALSASALYSPAAFADFEVGRAVAYMANAVGVK
jgi:hypothetical protein